MHRGRVGPVIGLFPCRMGPNDGPTGHYGGSFIVTAVCWSYGFKSTGVGPICDVT